MSDQHHLCCGGGANRGQGRQSRQARKGESAAEQAGRHEQRRVHSQWSGMRWGRGHMLIHTNAACAETLQSTPPPQLMNTQSRKSSNSSSSSPDTHIPTYTHTWCVAQLSLLKQFGIRGQLHPRGTRSTAARAPCGPCTALQQPQQLTQQLLLQACPTPAVHQAHTTSSQVLGEGGQAGRFQTTTGRLRQGSRRGQTQPRGGEGLGFWTLAWY